MTVVWNGVTVHKDVALNLAGRRELAQEEPTAGALRLQTTATRCGTATSG